MKTYTCMLIGECISDTQVREFNNLADAHLARLLDSQVTCSCQPISTSRLLEEGGNMVVLITTFAPREASLHYHTSRNYRQFVSATQHLLVGDFVVKLFESMSPPVSAN